MAIETMAAKLETAPATGDVSVSVAPPCSILSRLARLDERIERALARAADVFGREATEFAQRGLCIEPQEVDHLLDRTPGTPLFGAGADESRRPTDKTAESTDSESRLRDLFGLDDFDLDVLLMAVAPEVDLRYERIYAYLQDDVTQRRPTVDLALNLFCRFVEEKLAFRSHFRAEAPLIRHGLLEVAPGGGASLLSRSLQVDDRIVQFLLGLPGLDPRLASVCEIIAAGGDWQGLPLEGSVLRTIPVLAAKAREDRKALRFYFFGQRNTGKRRAAEALAGALGVPLLTADLARIAESGAASLPLAQRVFREARLLDAILYVTGLGALRAAEASAALQSFFAQLEQFSGITILAGSEPWIPAAKPELAVIPVEFQIPDFSVRRACWDVRLGAYGFTLDADDYDDLAGRFRLTAGQIGEAVEGAINRARWRDALAVPPAEAATTSAAVATPSLDDLYVAACAQCGHDLARLTRKLNPRYRWDDIVLPSDQMTQLSDICAQAHYRHVVFGEWGFDRKLSLGKGLNALFAGPPGTGKTMAAEVIANELRLDLYKIDLSQVINKYIGETEKNLDRIFTAAENSNAILLFDEADALFGRRSEVRDSHDRYANIEISYLLQKMEEYQGISILATNLRQNLDDAFTRRLQAIVEFPFPDEEYRRRIWELAFPKEAPLADSVDFGLMAREVPLAGGNVKNMALAAAFYAAEEGDKITMVHLKGAADREFQKLGRTWMPSEILQRAAV